MKNIFKCNSISPLLEPHEITDTILHKAPSIFKFELINKIKNINSTDENKLNFIEKILLFIFYKNNIMNYRQSRIRHLFRESVLHIHTSSILHKKSEPLSIY
jgi:hypothetical protein